ncbi:MAG TPA: MFS transporter [Mycobacteriales bacterium]
MTVDERWIEGPRLLPSLALGIFTAVTSELVAVGVLGPLAADLRVSPGAAAAAAVSAYALGVAGGGPLLWWLTSRLDLRKTMVLLLSLLALADVLAAIAPSLAVLAPARTLSGAADGAFSGWASAVAVALGARSSRAGRTVATLFTGATIASVIGLPGAALLCELGGWRLPFLVVGSLAALTALTVARHMPSLQPQSAQGTGHPVSAERPRRELGRTAVVLATALLGSGGSALVFSFVGPYLHQVAGFPERTLPLLLLVHGLAATAGVRLSGPAADRWPQWTPGGLLLLAAAALLGLRAAGGSKPAVVVLLAVWGLAGLALTPVLQRQIVTVGEGSGALAATLNVAALHTGILAGSLVGASAVDGGRLADTPLLGAAGLLLAATLTWLTRQPIR